MSRALHLASLAVLLVAAAVVGVYVYDFSQARFFTIDEWQFGHATWLVARGELPYVDFFEHHFPLSYVLHAPFFIGDGSFVASALLLRRIVFVTILAVSVGAGVTAWRVTGSAHIGWLAAILPPCVGFGLMSLVDYRADSLAALWWIACLLLLEWNRKGDRRWVAVAAGVVGVVAAFMTQKTAFVAALTIAIFWVADRLSRNGAAPFISRPLSFAIAATSSLVAVLVAGLLLGILPAALDATILQALAHEDAYPRFSIFERGYVDSFWNVAWLSTSAIVVFALGWLPTRDGRFWAVPIGVALLAGALMAAPYPYNFVFLCYAVALAGVRGFAWVASRAPERWRPLLLLLPLAVLPQQLSFVADATPNENQLRILSKIEYYGGGEAGVIDNAGGAMFSPDASYYFHHGAAHREIFADYFENDLLADYERANALFWIRDMRASALPEHVDDYLHAHFVRADGDLYALGFRTEPTGANARKVEIDVVQGDDYFVHRWTGGFDLVPGPTPGLAVDGRPATSGRLRLEEGRREIEIPPGAPSLVITPLPAEFFELENDEPYSRMFEYGQTEPHR